MKKDRSVVITGAGGKIGRSLIKRIIEHTNWRVFAFSSSLDESVIRSERLEVHKNDDIPTLLPKLNGIDTCVHLAFSRRFNTNSEIALSLDFSSSLFKAARECGCRVINLSTVGVYGLNPFFPNETIAPSPDSLYSMAKYASEVLLDSWFQDINADVSNVRLSGIAQSQRVLPVFIEDAKSNGVINIVGGKQEFSWIDIEDAVDALIALISYEGRWRKIYNVSLNKTRYNITDLAKLVAIIAKTKGFGEIKIAITANEENPICVGWNSEAFTKDTGWRPQVKIKDTIISLF